MKIIRRVAIVVVILVLALVLYQNYDVLTQESKFKLSLHFIGWYTSPLPLGLIILIAFAIGYAAAYLFGFVRAVSYRRRLRQLERELHTVDTPSPPVSTPPPRP